MIESLLQVNYCLRFRFCTAEPNSDFRGPRGLGTENAHPWELRSHTSSLTCHSFYTYSLRGPSVECHEGSSAFLQKHYFVTAILLTNDVCRLSQRSDDGRQVLNPHIRCLLQNMPSMAIRKRKGYHFPLVRSLARSRCSLSYSHVNEKSFDLKEGI